MRVSYMQKTSYCLCRTEGVIRVGKSDDYTLFNKALNRGRHPTFIGREMYRRFSRNGGAIFLIYQEDVIAVALVNPRNSCLMVLNVNPNHRDHGLGSFMIGYLMCNFARVITSAVPFFEKNGYKKLGVPFQGRKLQTWVMVRESLIELSGKMKRVYALSQLQKTVR